MNLRAIITGLIIGILATGLAFYLVPQAPDLVSYLTLQTPGFDCAEQFDHMVFAYQMVQDKHPARYTTQILDFTTPLGKEFFFNHCASSVDWWAGNSKNEWVIWETGIRWEVAQQLERVFHSGECVDGYDIPCPLF